MEINSNIISQKVAYIIGICLLVSACSKNVTSDMSSIPLIPKPISVTATNQTFFLTEKTKIYVDLNDEGLLNVANYLASVLKASTNTNLKVLATNSTPRKGHLSLVLDKTKVELGNEGYEVDITKSHLVLTANQLSGLMRGIQTIRQLLPIYEEKEAEQTQEWGIATGKIIDYPRYEYRGAMLDIARHFFGVKDIKRYIDLLTYYKINTLHLHLTDDQGWRIEIKSWPELTKIGGSTEVGGGEGGFLTQEDYKEIVRYASERFITIIPEIDMPGHTNAALASYPELNCDGKAPELYTGIEVGFSSLCIHKDITYQFVDDVISEIAAITPGSYIHIGGDESHSTKKEDFIFFINKAKKIVYKYGKSVIGWDEIAHANIDSSTVMQYWNNAENVQLGIAKGSKVILSPATHTYLDMKYDSATVLGLNWAGFIEVDKAYQWNPDTIVKGLNREYILGVESPLWSETVENMEDIEYMAFPRLVGFADIAWSQNDDLNWNEYEKRLVAHKNRLKSLGINFYLSPKVNW